MSLAKNLVEGLIKSLIKRFNKTPEYCKKSRSVLTRVSPSLAQNLAKRVAESLAKIAVSAKIKSFESDYMRDYYQDSWRPLARLSKTLSKILYFYVNVVDLVAKKGVFDLKLLSYQVSQIYKSLPTSYTKNLVKIMPKDCQLTIVNSDVHTSTF